MSVRAFLGCAYISILFHFSVQAVFFELVSPSMAVMADWSGFGALGA